MTTKGLLISGVAAVAVLFAGGLLLVYLADRGADGAASPVRTAAGQVAVASQAPAPLAPSPATSARPERPSPAESAPPAAPAAPALPASMSERVKALEPLRQEVLAGLATFDARLERCELRDADLVLTLETMAGAVRIVEVQVTPAGAATAEATGVAPPPLDPHVVRCLHQVLDQSSFQAPSAVPGRRWPLAYRPGVKP